MPKLHTDIATYTRGVPKALSHTDKPPAPAPVDEKDVEEDAETPAQLEERLKKLVNQDRVMLFMKGSPDVPRCGFSRQIVGILKEQNVEFGHFDILTDERVRSGASLNTRN